MRKTKCFSRRRCTPSPAIRLVALNRIKIVATVFSTASCGEGGRWKREGRMVGAVFNTASYVFLSTNKEPTAGHLLSEDTVYNCRLIAIVDLFRWKKNSFFLFHFAKLIGEHDRVQIIIT